MKNLLILFFVLAMQTACNSQQNPNSYSISGKVKTAVAGKVYLELLNERGIASKIDSCAIKNNVFSFKGTIPEPNFYQINIANQQKLMILLEGNDNLTIEADGFDTPEKKGTYTATGSKAMEHLLRINGMAQELQSRVTVWQVQYQDANNKKDNARQTAIQQEFEVAQKELVAKIKAMIPEMGTSLVSLYATNFLNPQNDMDAMVALADKFEKEGVKYRQAQLFISQLKRMRGSSIGGQANDFELSDLNGNKVKLSSLKGNVVVLDFWATWCGPCVRSFPGMIKASEKYKDQPVKFFFVDTFERVAEPKAHVKNFLEQKQYSSLPVLFDTGEVAGAYGVNGIPAKFVIDKNGNISGKSEGFMGSDEAVVEEISRMIEEAMKK